jgi:hypothetical protein
MLRQRVVPPPERACKTCGHALSNANHSETCNACQIKAAAAKLPKPVPLPRVHSGSRLARIYEKGAPMEYQASPQVPVGFTVEGITVKPCPVGSSRSGPWPTVIEKFLASGMQSGLVENGKQKATNTTFALKKCIRPDQPVEAITRGGKCYLVRKKAEGR